MTSSVPFQYLSLAPISIPGRDPGSLPKQLPTLILASEHYAEAIGLRLVSGHWFTAPDYDAGAASAVINESLAKMYWPEEPALGQCLHVGPEPECRTIVGIVADTRQTRLQEERRPQLYLSVISDPKVSARLPRTLVVRSSRGLGIAKAVKLAMEAANSNLPFVQMQSLESIIAPKVRPWLLGSTVFFLFGGLALVLAAFGLYGSVSYAVAERTHEFGIRTALGARGADVALLVLRQVLVVALGGIAIGGGAALLLGPRVVSLLFDLSARDPSVFSIAAITLVATTVVACYAPVRRAVGTDPIRALRVE
jgi:putative ABC transport system permease protein